jgi:hypothetical protein
VSDRSPIGIPPPKYPVNWKNVPQCGMSRKTQ